MNNTELDATDAIESYSVHRKRDKAMIDMPMINEFVKDLKIAIPAMLDDDISEEESIEIIRVIIKDKDIYEAFVTEAFATWTNNPECEKAIDEYNNILSMKIDELHEKFWEN